MRIEALILTRNEEDNLADCIHSIRAAVDGITVFDTGSKDNTSELARELGVKWVSIPWRHDFAAARNLALRKMDTDWVLVVDADERLDRHAIDSIHSILRDDSSERTVHYLEKRTYTDNVESLGYIGMQGVESNRRGAAGYVPHPEPRVFKLKAGFCYDGLINEQLVSSNGEEPPFEPPMGILHHLCELQPLATRARRFDLHLRLGLRDVLQNSSASSFARLGAHLNSQNRWEAALSYLRVAEMRGEESPALHLQAGFARLQLGLIGGAEASFRKANDALPAHPEICAWLARTLIETGRSSDFQEAGVLLELAIEAAPELELAVLQKAIWHRKHRQYDESRAYLQTLLENNPVHPSGLKELGTLELLQGKPRESEHYLRQALRMRPEDAEILNNLGCALERRGLWREALENFRRAVSLDGGEPRYLRNCCIADAACGRYRDLCKDSERALLASDQPQELLLRLREDCLEGGWHTALRKLEDWAVTHHWLRREDCILPGSERLVPEPA